MINTEIGYLSLPKLLYLPNICHPITKLFFIVFILKICVKRKNVTNQSKIVLVFCGSSSKGGAKSILLVTCSETFIWKTREGYILRKTRDHKIKVIRKAHLQSVSEKNN